MKRKEHLIKSLKIVIDALKNDTVYYNWKEQCSCNMGVTAQALLKATKKDIDKLTDRLFGDIAALNKDVDKKDEKYINPTWKNAVKQLCPITGESMYAIINQLEDCGMSREDIVHLEYLENEAILAGSGIEKVSNVIEKIIGYKTEIQTVPSNSIIGKILGKTKQIEVNVPIIEYETVWEYPKKYYSNKENLIKYLISWVNILSSNIDENQSLNTDKKRLQAQLLNAVAEESYERAAIIRDQLTMVNQ